MGGAWLGEWVSAMVCALAFMEFHEKKRKEEEALSGCRLTFNVILYFSNIIIKL